MKDKRCAICKERFTQRCNKQKYCDICVGYMHKYRDEKKARLHRFTDAQMMGKPLSTMPVIEGCKGCIYWKPLVNSISTMACHYCYDTGELRKCCPGPNCEKRINKKGVAQCAT